jgi:4-hydroxybutyrate CoA-transferase
MTVVEPGLRTGVQKALSLVNAGATVVAGSGAAEPRMLLAGLAERARQVGDITLLSGMLLSDYRFLDVPRSSLRYRTWFMPGSLQGRTLDPSRVEFLPLAWSQMIDYLERLAIDVALVQVSPKDADGFHSLGVSVSYTKPAARRATVVLAEVNAQMPRTAGDSLIHESELDAVVHVDYPIPAFPARKADAAGRRIAETAAAIITDGMTVQPGVGAIPNELMAILADRNVDVNLLSIMTDGCIPIVRNAAARGQAPVARVGEIVGSKALYDFVAENPGVAMAEGRDTHTAVALAGVQPFVAVNSAVEVDLAGQSNQEMMGGRQAGGIGGSIDFMIAGSYPGNRSLLLLKATAQQGRISRIVPRFTSPVVSVPRSVVQVVVTEFGLADLADKTVEERARALIGIAAPQHRAALTAEWERGMR